MIFLILCLGIKGFAQGQVGLSAGAGFFFISGYDGNSGYAEHEMRYPALSLSAFVRRNAQPVGFALHGGYMHKAVQGAWHEGGMGASESRNGDFSLHALSIAMAPEFATDSTGRTALRIGVEARLAVAGRFKGKAHEYNMNPQYGPNYSVKDTVMFVGGLEAMLFLGMRITASANDRHVTTIEPYIGYAPISNLVDGGPNTRWIECGVAVGLARKRRAGPLEQPAG